MSNNFEMLSTSLYDLLTNNKDVYILVADGLETYVLKDFQKKCTEEELKRVINVGISEQNAVSLASGLALGGKIPYLVMFSSFMVTRAAEQVKLDICYANANVKMIGINAGLSGITLAGFSHCSVEDIAILDAMPNIEIFSPAPNKNEFEEIIKHSITHKGPCYIRLNHPSAPHISTDYDVKTGNISKVIKGSDAAILSHGYALEYAIQKAGEINKERGYMPSVYSVHTLKPFDEEAVLKIAEENIPIITIEEHAKGGLASLVSEVIAKSNKAVEFLPIYVEKEDYRAVINVVENVQKRFLDSDSFLENFSKITAKKHKKFFKVFSKKYKLKNGVMTTSYKFLGIPVFKTKGRTNVKPGKLKHKYYILGLRVL